MRDERKESRRCRGWGGFVMAFALLWCLALAAHSPTRGVCEDPGLAEDKKHLLEKFLADSIAGQPVPPDRLAAVDTVAGEYRPQKGRSCLEAHGWELVSRAIAHRRRPELALDLCDAIGWADQACTASIQETVFAASFVWIDPLTEASSRRARSNFAMGELESRAQQWVEEYIRDTRKMRMGYADYGGARARQIATLWQFAAFPRGVEERVRDQLVRALLESPVRAGMSRSSIVQLLRSFRADPARDAQILRAMEGGTGLWSAEEWDVAILCVGSLFSRNAGGDTCRRIADWRGRTTREGQWLVVDALARVGGGCAARELLSFIQDDKETEESKAAKIALLSLLGGDTVVPPTAGAAWWAMQVAHAWPKGE